MGLIETRILTDHVYETIKLMIRDGALKPGAKINKKELESLLGVSQTPINDALSRLAGQKHIEQRNRRGYFVRKYSCRELVDLFAARGAVEGMAARLAVENASDAEIEQITRFFADVSFPLSEAAYHAYERTDREFHSLLIEYSRNAIMQEINEQFGYIVRTATTGLVRPPEETIGEHRAIIAAIRERNPRLAGELMTEHHLRSRDVLVKECRD